MREKGVARSTQIEKNNRKTSERGEMAKKKKTGEWAGNRSGQGNPGDDIWGWFHIRWHFLCNICASTPANPEIIQAWLKARQPKVIPPGARSIEEINEEAMASIERGDDDIDAYDSMLVFQRHHGHLVMRNGTIKAHIKDCSRVVSAQAVAKIEGERAFSTRSINGIYYDQRVYWTPLLRPGGHVITEADGAFDKPVHTRDRRGRPINALKRFEFVSPPCYMEFYLKVLSKSVPVSDLHKIFNYGGTHGYAGERSDGEGRYEYEFQEIEAPPPVNREYEFDGVVGQPQAIVEPPAQPPADPDGESDHPETRTDPARVGA